MEWLETLPVHLKPKRISILPQGSKPERWKRLEIGQSKKL